MRWMNLESIVQSKVSQKEKSKYYILVHIYGLQKDDTDKIICGAAVETQTQRTDLWTQEVGEEGEDGIIGDSNMETYFTIFKIDSQ